MTLFRFTESRDSRRTTTKPPTYTAAYSAAGSNDAAYVRAYAIAATPAVVNLIDGTVYRQDVAVDPVGYELWRVTVPYAKNEVASGSYRITFDTTGGTIHITASKETINRYPAGTAPDCKQLIGVNADQVEGADIVIPALKMSVHFTHPAAIITLSRIKYLASITGMVNGSEFLTFDAGEVLFLGASGSEGTSAETEVTYQFAMSSNASGLTIGDIANIVKAGHNIAWIKYKDAVDAPEGTSLPVKQPEFVYVERVYDVIDLALGLGFG
jgi:hypothetical protein